MIHVLEGFVEAIFNFVKAMLQLYTLPRNALQVCVVLVVVVGGGLCRLAFFS
jgi:hypothetical protein